MNYPSGLQALATIQALPAKGLIRLTCFLLFLNAPVANAAQPLPLHLDVMDLAPYGFTGPRGEVSGVFVELLRRISQGAGINAHHRLLSVPRLLQQLDNGASHCSLFLSQPPLQQSLVRVTDIPWRLDIIALSQPATRLQNLGDLRRLRVAVPRGVVFGNQLDAPTAFIRENTTDYEQGIRMLERGRVDAVVGTAPSLFYTIKKRPLPVKELLIDSKTLSLYCISSVSRADRNQLQLAAQKLEQSGELQRIIADYVDNIF